MKTDLKDLLLAIGNWKFGNMALGMLSWISFFTLVCGVPLPSAVVMSPTALMMHEIFMHGVDETPKFDGFTSRPRGGWVSWKG